MNSVELLYEGYLENYRDGYAHDTPDAAEKMAFCHGVIAAFSMVRLSPAKFTNRKTQMTIEQELAAILNPQIIRG